MQQQSADLARTRDLLMQTNAQLGLVTSAAENVRAQLAEAIDVIGQGFALFGADDRMVMCNTHFCDNLREVRNHLKPGLTFERYIDLLSRSDILRSGNQSSAEDWRAWRLDLHRQSEATFNISLIKDRHFQVSSLRMASGATVITHSDVTHLVLNERRERDALMERQALLLQATLEHLDQAVCIFDTRGDLIGRNDRLSELLDLPEDVGPDRLNQSKVLRHLQMNAVFLGRAEFHDLDLWTRDLSSRPPVSFEVGLTTGRTLAMSCKTIPSWGIVFSFTDVTAERSARDRLSDLNEQLERRVRERTEELGTALRKAERATATKSRYLAAASHDLMQPLSSAKLFVSAISDSSDDPAILDIAHKTDTSLTHLQDIIEALMEIAKLDSDRVELDRQPLQLNAVFQTLIEQFTPIAARKGLSLSFVPSTLVVESDPGYLRRILENLISNAVRYTEEGRILIGVRRRGRYARIEVRDTGRGLAKADQSLIFDEFRKVDRSSSQGLGLGLAIVKRACAALDHPVDVWSNVGQGSTFAVSVPVLETVWSIETALRVDQRPLPHPDCEGLIVLLVENDVQLSRAIAMQLETWGALVVPANSAQDALSLLEEDEIVPDALVLDYQLDGVGTGVDVYQAFAARHGRQNALIVTADNSDRLAEHCAKAGLDVLSKPVDRGRLLDFLNLARRQTALPAAGTVGDETG